MNNGLEKLHIEALAYDSTTKTLYAGTGIDSGFETPRGIWMYTDDPFAVENWMKYR